MFLLYHAYVYLEFLILACTIYILAPLKAQTSMQDYALAVQKLIEACNSESEGFPILIPLVGTGLSRTKKDQKDVLSYLVQAFKLNKSELNCDIHIIVRETIKSDIPIMNLK